MKDLKGLKDLMSMLKDGAERESAEKKVIISIDTEATEQCGAVSVKLENIDKGADLIIASAALLSTCFEYAVEGKETDALMLILFLATEVFGEHCKTEQGAIEHSEEDLRKLEMLLSALNGKED